ncbi:hypothetical protein [Caulobacter segnis]|uniref:Uncharacterized protein n=1 Tax=Caulobacter segnis TaxID=88688 RepID=A0A2W5VJI2_9CAUL|nr:hypothetical protein [Caulobacter segnis]PZR36846.1 MAG: hypothetical protein DI526_02585 [Caulobacter segnis]
MAEREPFHRSFGYSIQDSIDGLLNELEIDAVGMWQIVPKGRVDFGLEGSELADFVRRHVSALVYAGALPQMIKFCDGQKQWVPDPKYGTDREGIIERVMNEWLADPIDPDVGGLWFQTP